MTTTAMTLTELRMKNNNPSRFLKQDDIELIVFLFQNASNAEEFEAELRKKFEKKCDICEVERDLETGECDCRIVECAACYAAHPKYKMNLVEGVCGLRCDECDPTQHTSCYECGECLDDPSTHIFCFEKEGEEDRTLCCECGQDLHKEYKSEGWTRDDESMLGSDDDEDEDEEDEDEEEEDEDEDEEKEYDPLVMRGEDCRGYKGCGNKLTTEGECRAMMCESCTNIWKGFEKDGVPCGLRSDLGAAIYAARNASKDEEELNSEDDDYEDKMEGKWKCRRCGENKASSVVFDDGDCLNYCRECLGDDEEDRYVCGVCGKTEPKDVEWDVGAMEDFRGDVICPDCLGDDEEKDELCSAIDASGNALW